MPGLALPVRQFGGVPEEIVLIDKFYVRSHKKLRAKVNGQHPTNFLMELIINVSYDIV